MDSEHRAHLRALAARVRTEEPSDALRDAVLIALGWGVTFSGGLWVSPDSEIVDAAPNPLTDLNASAAALPAGWRIVVLHDSGRQITVTARRGFTDTGVTTVAPTEPHARTAAALMARAAEVETANG